MADYAIELKPDDYIIVIVGGPRTGKSTLAQQLRDRGYEHYCGDPLSKVKEPLENVTYLPEDLEWSQGSQYVADEWFNLDGPVVFEGQIMARALRKWTGDACPADRIFVLRNHHPKAIVNPGQAAMHKSVMTVWQGIEPKFREWAEYPVLG